MEKPHAYIAGIKNVYEKCGIEVTKDNILARSNINIDKHHSIIKGMLIEPRSITRHKYHSGRIKEHTRTQEFWTLYLKPPRTELFFLRFRMTVHREVTQRFCTPQIFFLNTRLTSYIYDRKTTH
jgi:hypothetical protein